MQCIILTIMCIIMRIITNYHYIIWCIYLVLTMHCYGLPCCLRQQGFFTKNLPAIWENQAWPLVWKILWRKKWQPTAAFLPGEFHGQRNLAGFSPWGCKELDMTERLRHTHKCTDTMTVISTLFSTIYSWQELKWKVCLLS